MLVFYCFTTSPWRTQANHLNKIHLHIIIIIIQLYILKKYFFNLSTNFNERSIYGLYIKSVPFFSDLENLLETKNNSRFYILKLFFLLHGNRFSCPVTSCVNSSLQSWCILFKIRQNRRFWPNKCFLLLS